MWPRMSGGEERSIADPPLSAAAAAVNNWATPGKSVLSH